MPADLDEAIEPCAIWIPFDWTLETFHVLDCFLLPQNFQMVMVDHPSVFSIGVREYAIALCDDVVD